MNNLLIISCKWYINTFKNLPIIVHIKSNFCLYYKVKLVLFTKMYYIQYVASTGNHIYIKTQKNAYQNVEENVCLQALVNITKTIVQKLTNKVVYNNYNNKKTNNEGLIF